MDLSDFLSYLNRFDSTRELALRLGETIDARRRRGQSSTIPGSRLPARVGA